MANNFPNLLPALNIDMVNGIYVDPRITFTRAGTRTYYGQEMVKAEENLFLNSATFPDSGGKVAVTVSADTEVAPDGTTTADTITVTAGNAAYYIAVTTSVISTPVTLSFYFKAGTHNYVQILNTGDTEAYANFDITAGAGVVGTTGSKTTSLIVDAGSGWFRCIATFDATAGLTAFYRVYIMGSASAGFGVFFNAAGTETIYAWGSQLEQRSFATAYTATTTQPITRYQRLLKTAAANEWPREFDPVTGECLGRSVWESRTNLLLRSEEFTNAYWTKSETTISANQIIAPDGTLTADKLVENTANSTHDVRRTIALTAVPYTFSLYAKAAERTGVQLRGVTGPGLNAIARFDLTTGEVASATECIASIINVGNGWYRCSITLATGNTSGFEYWARLVSGTTTSYEGDGTSGIYIWGAMLESGAFATPYTPTVASQVTRVADSAVMTGVNFSSWYRQDEGAFFVDATNSGAFGIQINIHDGTANNQYQVLTGTSGTAFLVNTGNVIQANIGTRANPAKTAASYKFNDFMASTNGSVPATDTSGTLPVVSVARIGSRYDNSNHINGYIKRLTYYNRSLASAELQAITR